MTDTSILRAICLPSSDAGFAAVVREQLDAGGITTAAALEDVLRPLFPTAVVRARELSGEDGVTWYVYRDGHYRAGADLAWFQHADTARAMLAIPSGVITAANDQIAELLGSPVAELVGEPYLDFVVPDARDAAAILFATCLRLGHIETVVRVRRPDGETIVLEVRAVLLEDGIELRFRRVTVAGG